MMLLVLVLSACDDAMSTASQMNDGLDAACDQIDELVGGEQEPSVAEIRSMGLPVGMTMLDSSDSGVSSMARDLVDSVVGGNTSEARHAVNALHDHCQLRGANAQT